jgi:hypothetical protein
MSDIENMAKELDRRAAEFYLTTSLYKPVLDEELVLHLESFTGPIDGYCPECKERSVFHIPAVKT